MENAKWRVGRLLVDPWVALRNVSYQNNLTETPELNDSSSDRISDFTASVGAGLNTYMTLGSDFIWGTFLLPEYVWWQDLEDRRRLNGRYGTGLFGSLGRVGVEATASRSEQLSVFSIEVDQPFNLQTDQALLDLTVDLGRGVLVFARGEENRFRSLERSGFELLSGLDRDETTYSAGVGFSSTRGFRLGLGFEQTSSDFLPSALDRSNDGSAVFVDLHYDGPLVKLAALVADRSLEPKAGSEFQAFDGTTASASVSFRASGPVWVDFFGRRNLSYSLQQTVAYIENNAVGAALSTALGSRARLRAFYEQGDSSFVEEPQSSVGRVDDRTSVGASLNFDLGRLSLSLTALQTDYDSNFSENDRQVTRFATSLAIGRRRSSPWG